MPLLIVGGGVALLVLLIIKFKLETFSALLMTTLLVGLTLGISMGKLPGIMVAGVGEQLKDLALIIVCGSMIGKLVADAGGSYVIASYLIKRFGVLRIQITVVLAAMIIGFALFFEVALVVLIPIIFEIAKELKVPLLKLGLPMVTTLNIMHGLMPPHPTPTALAEIVGADIGDVILVGIIVAIPTMLVAGPLWNTIISHLSPGTYRFQTKLSGFREDEGRPSSDDLPHFSISVITTMMPVILIGALTGVKQLVSLPRKFEPLLKFLADPNVAMILSLMFAIYTMGIGRKRGMSKITLSLNQGVKQVALVIFLIGAGGAFKQVLEKGGVAEYISLLFADIHLSPLLAGWLIAALMHVCLGSSTVAAMTSGSLMSPLIIATHADPVLVVLAIGAGSIFGDNVTDAGFWMVKEYLGLSVKETFAVWSTSTVLIAVAGLGVISFIGLF